MEYLVVCRLLIMYSFPLLNILQHLPVSLVQYGGESRAVFAAGVAAVPGDGGEDNLAIVVHRQVYIA